MTAERQGEENLSDDIDSIRNQSTLDYHNLSEQSDYWRKGVTEEVEQVRDSVPGHNEAYNRIWGMDDEMSESLVNEDQPNNPAKKVAINFHPKEIIKLLSQ